VERNIATKTKEQVEEAVKGYVTAPGALQERSPGVGST
jgi:hypothetical protein